jgi:hypothetical protein
VPKIRKRLAVNKQGSHKVQYKKLNEEKDRKKYPVEVSNRYAALE